MSWKHRAFGNSFEPIPEEEEYTEKSDRPTSDHDRSGASTPPYASEAEYARGLKLLEKGKMARAAVEERACDAELDPVMPSAPNEEWDALRAALAVHEALMAGYDKEDGTTASAVPIAHAAPTVLTEPAHLSFVSCRTRRACRTCPVPTISIMPTVPTILTMPTQRTVPIMLRYIPHLPSTMPSIPLHLLPRAPTIPL